MSVCLPKKNFYLFPSSVEIASGRMAKFIPCILMAFFVIYVQTPLVFLVTIVLGLGGLGFDSRGDKVILLVFETYRPGLVSTKFPTHWLSECSSPWNKSGEKLTTQPCGFKFKNGCPFYNFRI